MNTKIQTRTATRRDQVMQEHNVLIDGVIEIPATIDPKIFFDGLLDKIIEYVEAHYAFAGLGMTYKKYEEREESSDVANGSENA